MKRPIHLYIFVILSSIASILRLFSAFVKTFNEEQLRTAMQGAVGIDVEELILVSRETANLQNSILQKIAALVLFGLLIAVIVFLFMKKNELASYLYIGYLFSTLLLNTYNYLASKGIANLYSDAGLRDVTAAGMLWAYILNIVLFAIYFGVTIFFHLRKPKEKPSTAINSTDI
ncbi:MFS transporter [Streptococcus iners]|uniref:MFS transporter n=1 Tax=Streptococcus iners TaxID=3028084 RepID=A0AA96VM62_9STRE|nr:MFS transporter [Streptococcus sp. 29887]MCK4024786.1 MFS transporter [Streptococcus suis]WNY51046.1 MFS transporter [Streptococcus sp. 29887]